MITPGDNEANYIAELWEIQAVMGGIATSLLVNAHIHNAGDPQEMDSRVDRAIKRLQSFKALYRKQHNTVVFNIS